MEFFIIYTDVPALKVLTSLLLNTVTCGLLGRGGSYMIFFHIFIQTLFANNLYLYRSSHLATSPTDKMMSPCSQKLAERKNKQFGMQYVLTISSDHFRYAQCTDI